MLIFVVSSGEETKDLQGTGLGDGQADNATTDDLESEDVFDGAEKPKKPEDEEENEEQDEKTKEEDGVEMSGDLDSQMQVCLVALFYRGSYKKGPESGFEMAGFQMIFESGSLHNQADI